MKVAIELMRSKNFGLQVFVVVGAAVYLVGNFTGDLRDQNRTLSKLEGPRTLAQKKIKVRV